MHFGPIPAIVGKGGGIVSAWFRFDRWIPNIFNIDISVPPETPIPYGFDITGFLAKGDASGDLKIGMEDLVLNISGDLSAHDTEISLNTDELAAAQRGDLQTTLKPVTVNLTVTTGKKVEFVWPSADFPILQAYAAMGTVVQVAADTQTGRFSIVSDVNIRSGEIFYFERSFYIRSGTLTFRENEIQFEPRITARAEARDRTTDGPVTISLIVDNAPLFNFTARFESNPPLSQMEIFSLLGQNVTGDSVDESTGNIQRAFVNSTADLLAQFQVVRRLERGVRDILGLDMFTVRTQILQNAIFQATGLQTPVDRNFRVGNYFDNTTVFIGKYFTPDFFGQSMLSLRYDVNQTTFGDLYPGGLALGGGMLLEGDFGLELHGPLFDIRMNFIPLHQESMFISDTSFSLIWNWSF
jgi:hypothetical protein